MPAGWDYSLGLAVNDSGEVTGLGFGPFSPMQAFVGTTSGSIVIPFLPGWTESFGEAINGSGQVVGYGLLNGATSLAFMYNGSGSAVIPLPTGATSTAVGTQSINDMGFVVGSSDVGGWIWNASDGTVLLNSLVPPGWNVIGALSISNNGLILAQASFDGGPQEYVELSAVATPEPGTSALVADGVICCWMGSRRRRAA
jgi:hypothetical protein